MPVRRPTAFGLVHADESCLRAGGQEGPAPGGAAGLIEVRQGEHVVRRDVYISSPATTNNRMALAGAVATFALLSQKGNRMRVVYMSDSRYLVDGMNEWLPAWRARGWRRKGGPIENLELWRKLAQAVAGHEASFRWVRGHDGHPKNEYADALAVRAARDQIHSSGAIPSGFDDWLAERRARGKVPQGYDPDRDFVEHESQLGTAL